MNQCVDKIESEDFRDLRTIPAVNDFDSKMHDICFDSKDAEAGGLKRLPIRCYAL